MKSYVYRVDNKPNSASGNPRGRVTVYRLDVQPDGRIEPRNVVDRVLIDYRTDTQAVCEELRTVGELPDGHTHGNLWRLREDGIAQISRV